jgi:Ca-activated chloride channel family protein
MTRQRAVALVAAALLLSGPTYAVPQRTFSSSALAVRVDVSVTDGRRPVPGLRAVDFELRDNGVAQTIEVVDATDIPVNAVLALDTSASTAGKRQADLVVASEALLAGLKPADRAALIIFSHAVAPVVALTPDLDAVRAALRRFEPLGNTAIMDAAYVALTATLAQTGRSLVVVCTDGQDTFSWLRPEEVLESAKRSNAVVYAVTADAVRRHSPLEDLADATGGQVLRVRADGDLTAAFQKILQDFRSRYILSYSPQGVPAHGFHRLDVRVKRGGMTVKARPGYVGVDPARGPR